MILARVSLTSLLVQFDLKTEGKITVTREVSFTDSESFDF